MTHVLKRSTKLMWNGLSRWTGELLSSFFGAPNRRLGAYLRFEQATGDGCYAVDPSGREGVTIRRGSAGGLTARLMCAGWDRAAV